MGDIAVQVRGVSKVFVEGDVRTQALKEINLEVSLGELLMIVGPSGCGKTTLLSVIAGTLEFDGGEIEVLGQSLKQMNEHDTTEFRGQNIGFIFQQYHLIPTLNCRENVSIPLIINGGKRRSAEAKADDLLNLVGLDGRGGSRPTMLSGGQQQRVAIARALVHEPRLVICDEPTAALDGETGSKILNLLQTAARNPNRAVIVVTHDSRIFKYADRIVQMEDGVVKRVTKDYRDLH